MARVSDEQVMKAFVFTVEEYKRFADFFGVRKQHSLLEPYTEKEYIATQTKLMLLRKYSYNAEPVYIPNIIRIARGMYAELVEKLDEIEKEYKAIEKNQLQSILSNGKKLELFNLQESIVYGIYLHSDVDKIENLLNTNESLFFTMSRKFVDEVEELVLKIYELVVIRMNEKFVRKEHIKAPVVFSGTVEGAKQEITGSPYWSNLYGKDLTDEELEKIVNKCTLEDLEILSKSLAFFDELEKENYSVDELEKLVFPPTRAEWGDFKKVKEQYKDEFEHLGWSTKVSYNERKDMAYVNVFINVKEAFTFEQPHIVSGIFTMTFVKENEDYGWRIFAIGRKLDEYREEIGVREWLRRTFKK